MDRLSRTHINNGWRLYLVILKYIHHKLYAVVLINSMGPEKLESLSQSYSSPFTESKCSLSHLQERPPPHPTQSQMNQAYTSSFTKL
jgi:hypothetical protein